MRLDAAIAEEAAGHFGIISRPQLLSLGATPKQIRVRVERGLLVPVHRGVYAIAGVPLSWKGRLLAARCCLGPKSVISHLSAAAWLRFDGFDEGPLEFTLTRPGHAPVPGLRLHSSQLPRCDIRLKGEFAITSVERTLIDLGSVVSDRRVEEALESALFQGLTNFRRVAARLEQVRGPGRRGAAVLGRLLDIRDPDKAPDESLLETRFYQLLRTSSLPKPVHQFSVFDRLGFVARLDLAFPDLKIGVQPIGLRVHSARLRVKKDAAQHNRLSLLGWVILYVTWEDCMRRPRQVLKQLEELIKERSLIS